MKILVQKKDDRDCIGLVNALQGHDVVLWQPSDDIKDVKADLYIFTEPDKLGFDAAKAATKTLFFKCVQPAVFKRAAISVETIPLCADMVRYPIVSRDNKLACDVFYLSNFKDRTDELSRVRVDGTFRIAGVTPANLANYIGRLDSPKEVSQYCLSAGVCIDFDFECAPDLLKIGARVITSKENGMGVPVFNMDNINEVIAGVLKEKKPVLNKYETNIITYKALADNLFEMLGL